MRSARTLALLLAFASLSPLPRAGAATAVASRPRVLPFLSDDYEKAVAEAKARKVPLFIEAWAPW